MIPDFIIVGAMRSGTTTLYSYLQQHLEIYMPPIKETHYYDKNYHKGKKWYENFFKKALRKQLVGEATPNYLFFPNIAGRIKKTNPKTKIIIVLRNPTMRAYSHYWHNKRRGEEWQSFETALNKEEQRLKNKSYFYQTRYSYKKRGEYARQIKKYYEHFPKKQVFIMLTENLKKNPEKELRKLYEFLRVKPIRQREVLVENFGGRPRIPIVYQLLEQLHDLFRKKNHELNTNGLKKKVKRILLTKAPPIKKQTRKKLNNYYKTHNKELRKITKLDLREWS